MKKTAIFLMIFILITSVFCGCSGEESIVSSSDISSKPQESPITDFEYKKEDDGTISITKYIGNAECVVIPEKIEGLSVSVISYEAFMENSLKSVTIPNTVRGIETAAFYNCVNLTEVDFGSGVEEIELEAFKGCTSLKRLVLPRNLKKLRRSAVSKCTSLEYVFIPKMAGCVQSFSNNPALKTVQFEEGATFVGGYGMFINCTALEEITIPAGVERLIEYTFQYCPNLKKITFLGDAPRDIGYDVFGEPNKEIKIYYNKNTSGWEDCPLAEDYTLIAQ